MMSDLITLAGLWKETGKNGRTYLAGRLTPTCRIMIFANSKKQEGSNQPDYHLVLAPSTSQERKAHQPPTVQEAAKAAQAPQDFDDLDDRLPF
jgi:hypothetical protein